MKELEMMKSTKLSLIFAAVLAAVVLAAPSLKAADYKIGNLTIETPWARASFGTSRPTAAFMTIHNAGDRDDALVSAGAPVAGRVEIHESKMVDGVMRMGRVDPLTIPAGGSVTLKPGSYHIMLMQLNTALVEDNMFPLTLTFRDAGKIEMDVPVKKTGAMKGGHGHGKH